MSVAGASGTVLEANVPYHSEALKSYLLATKPQGCNTHTARAMAMVAYQRAQLLAPGKNVYGLGATAALATHRDRRGQDRCHVAIQSADKTIVHETLLDKNLSRLEQESICNELIVAAIAQALGINDTIVMSQPIKLDSRIQPAEASWEELLAGTITGAIKSTATKDYDGIFPGAFNPMHEGHREMLDYYRRTQPGAIALEISIHNVDKSPLDFMTMAERALAITDIDLVFTNAPTFRDKAQLFPGATFIVGLDTIVRIDDPKYYDNESARDAAIQSMANQGNHFLVFGRLMDGNFVSLGSTKLTPSLREMCIEVPESEFRQDTRSSELRAR